MFFDNLSEIEKISGQTGTSVFVLPPDTEFEIPGAIVIKPEEKTVITIEQVRKMMEQLVTKQTKARFVVIRPADMLGLDAENAILKSLEEPGENIHFILVTDDPSKLLPTILSRAAVYVYRGILTPINKISADDKCKEMAKKILSAKSNELVDLAEELTSRKDGVRAYVLNILAVAIEMAYKSYFLTGKVAFLGKIPKLLTAHENITRNGHIKLHLVADLI